MKHLEWDVAKNEILKRERGVSFEDIVAAIGDERVLDEIEHPNSRKYAHQRVMVVEIDSYVYLVPFVEDEEKRFLKTIIPSHKFTKYYLFDVRKK